MSNFYTQAPEVRCQRCGHRFNHAAHWELKLVDDAELTCPECDSTLRLSDEEAVRRWCWRAVDGRPVRQGTETKE